MTDDPDDADASRLAAEALSRDDPTGWFERLYAEAAAGDAIVPWDRDEPNPLLVEWAGLRELDGAGGKQALVVGCGLGRDAEYVGGLGFRTIAFDISETAVRGARARFPGSAVDYVVADLLDPPAEWAGAFDLVVESITVQSMPLTVRADAIVHVGRMVAPGGVLVVISGIREEGEDVDGPPWPLTRSEVESFAAGGLRAIRVEQVPRPEQPGAYRWRAEFRRT
ncbi:MAG: class I SAM-dependent methyltransferase [Streptomyces sp.]|uniref:class I SAM-dependent methyltransferase n=1 Tax=Streptomyces sp. TaxID=1931 RepID=UPI003D6AFE60